MLAAQQMFESASKVLLSKRSGLDNRCGFLQRGGAERLREAQMRRVLLLVLLLGALLSVGVVTKPDAVMARDCQSDCDAAYVACRASCAGDHECLTQCALEYRSCSLNCLGGL